MMNKMTPSSQKGFTLVEMAIVVLIIGLIVGSVFSFMSVKQQQQKYDLTKQRQHKIAQALTNYVQLYGVLPCPAERNLDPDDFGGPRTGGCTNATQLQGAVPYRVLGLNLQDIVDSYDRPFTYVVSETAANPKDDEVYRNCRTATWIIDDKNINKNKAIFCCQRSLGNKLKIYRKDGTNANSDLVSYDQDHRPPGSTQANPGDFTDVDTVATGTADYLGYVAYALISHGNNGEGSYTLPNDTDQTNNRKTIKAGTSNVERENADDDMVFVDQPINMGAGSNYFDDIVLWRTQESLMIELGNDSCARP